MSTPEQSTQFAHDRSQIYCGPRPARMPCEAASIYRICRTMIQNGACKTLRITKACLVLILIVSYVQPSAADAQTRFQSATPTPEHSLSGTQLLESLRTGGLVIYFRHAAIETEGSAPANCRGTSLSRKGQEEARFIGQQFSRLKIPIGKVLTSPSCRTMDHARISFGEFEPVEYVFGERNNFDKLADRLTAKFTDHGNLVIVGHVSGMNVIAGPPLLEYSEAIVVRPGENPAIVARLKLGDWEKLEN